MRRFSTQLGVLSLLLLVAVLYGMELTSSGIERINGPALERTTGAAAKSVPAAEDDRAVDSEWVHDHEVELKKIVSTPLEEPVIPNAAREPGVDRLADKTAGLLQIVAHHGIRMVVSLFDSITQ